MAFTRKTTNGYEFLIDESDAEFVDGRSWFAQGRTNFMYVASAFKENGKFKIKYLHRLLLGATGKNVYVDHINHNTLDNRRSNIRLSNAKNNQYNTKKKGGCLSKYKGVTFENNKWRARIRKNGKKLHLGSFDIEEDAARAYDAAALKIAGEHALTNFGKK